MSGSLQNFHLPLPVDLYQQLKAEAKRQKMPATALARDVIAGWVKERQCQLRQEEIIAYARQVAGSEADFDPLLEASACEHLLESEGV